MAKHYWKAMPRGSRMGTRRLKCRRCGKSRYTSKENAEADLTRIQLYGEQRKETPVRVYECPEGWWHLTSKEYDKSHDNEKEKHSV